MQDLKKVKGRTRSPSNRWKLIFYGYYEISLTGSIRRVRGAPGTAPGRVLTPYLQFKSKPEGDLRVSLQRGKGKRLQTTVKRLLYKAWRNTCHYRTP